MLRIKAGVTLGSLSPQMVLAVLVVHEAFASVAAECTITSADDGKHSEKSLHYAGNALDFRTRTLPEAAKSTVVDVISKALGREYDVVLESTHLHIEYQPRASTRTDS